MTRLEREYETFGPWIFEIRNIEDIPEYFQKMIVLDDNIKVAVKIPVEVDRRDVKPGMILYDRVILLHSEYIQFIKKVDNNLENYKVKYKEILAVKNSKNLLRGKITLFISEDKNEIIDYNIVSSDLIDTIIRIIRENITDKKALRIFPALDEEKSSISFFYKNLKNRLEIKEKITLLGYQPESILQRYKNNIYTYFKDKFHGTTLHSILFLTNNKEIIIINTEDEVDGNKVKGHKYIYTFIPVTNIKEIKILEDDVYKNIKSLLLLINDSITFKYCMEHGAELSDWIRIFKV